MRTYCIIHKHREADVFKNIADKLEINSDDKVLVFHSYDLEETEKKSNLQYVKIPTEISDFESKTRNFIVKYLLSSENKGFAHVIDEGVEFYGDPKNFNAEIEKMMKKLDLHLWMNTRCDECNYVFDKYDPRFSIVIDDPEMKKLYDKKILWTSHSNLAYVIFDLDAVTFEEAELDEKFKVPMFFIIEFLAKRRANKLGFMNLYPSIDEEGGVFRNSKCNFKKDYDEQKQLEVEDKIFKELNIDHTADGDVDLVMEFICTRLKKTSSETKEEK